MRNLRKGTMLFAAGLAAFAIGCGSEAPSAEHESGGEPEAHKEGIAEHLDGLQYNIFLTRQLNLADSEDSGYTTLDPPEPGQTYYASFFQVCNTEEADGPTHMAASEMEVEDSQGNVFEPLDISDSQFAYAPVELAPGDCIPEKGSLTDMGPAGGALVVFELPVETTENRPLDLTITSPEAPPAGGEPHTLTITLDL